MRRFLTILLAISFMIAVAVPLAIAGGVVYRYPPGVGYSRYGGGVQYAPPSGHSIYGRGYYNRHHGGYYGGYYGGTNRHTWETAAVLGGTVILGKVLDGIFGSPKTVVVQQPAAGYGGYATGPNCSGLPTPGERNACEQGWAQTQKQIQAEREQRAYQYGRSGGTAW